MTTVDFIDLLDQKRLAPANIVRQLRAKAAQGDDRITPKSILKYLVKKDIVTRSQAKELLETTLLVSDKAESSILGLTPLFDAAEVTKQVSEPPDRSTPPVRPPVADSFAESAELEDELIASQTDDLFSTEEPVLLDPIEPPAPVTGRPAPGSKLRPATRATKGKPAPKRKGPKIGDKSQWDSPLLLLGGAGLAVLAVGSVVLWWLLFRESADESLKLANDAFERGSYQVASNLYKEFTDKYPSHQDSNWAKVRMETSKLWEATESRNFTGAADMAPAIITEIEDEPAFVSNADESSQLSDAKQELAVLLPRIGAGLAELAELSDDEKLAAERIEQTQVILELSSNTKYAPEELRQSAQLEEVREAVERVQSRLQRSADLSAALVEMDEKTKAGDPAGALKLRATLLVNYPTLVDNEPLEARVREAADAERANVKFVPSSQPAITQEPATAIVAELALAERTGESTATEGFVVICVDGTLCGLNTADGSLLWRRFIGVSASTYPLLANGNIITADVQRQELICLNGQNGKLNWRLPLEGTLATPTLAGDRLLVGSDAGKLYVVKHASGELLGHVPFGQPLRLPAAVSERGDRVYVLGEHSNLYTLSGADLSCLGVHYLGHSAGSIAAPPALVLNKVIVADNSGAETSRIRALALDDQGVVANEVASHRLSGLVITPLQVAARRVAAVTTLGQAVVFEASGGNDKSALTVLAGREPQNQEPLAQFALLHDGHLWVASRQMTKLAILPTGNQLPVRALERDYRGDAFDYPLQAAGDLVIHLRRRAGQAGAIVAAMHAEAGPTWETRLAVPPAGPPAVDASGLRITAGAASGAVFLLDREAMARRVQNEAERLGATQADAAVMTDSLALAQGRLVLGGVGSSKLLLFRPDDPRQSLKAVELTGPLSCQPVAWRDGFVSAANVGQVTLHNADDASPVATPFQPELTPGQEYNWLRPAAVGTGTESQLVVSDGGAKLYLLSVEPQPQPHLKAVAAVDVGASPLTTPLAVVGNQVFAGNEAGQLARYALPELTAGAPIALGGRVAWGPHIAGDGVLLGIESGELLMVSGDGAVRWRHPLKHGTPGGIPLIDGENVFLLFPAGGLARIALGDGAEGAYAELSQPAIAGPVAFGPRLVVSAPDGTLLIVNRP